MIKPQKGFFASTMLTVAVIVVIGSGVYFYNSNKNTLPQNQNTPSTASSTNNGDGAAEDLSLPVITSISQSSGEIGTIIELRGKNLAGFEGDLDAIIENNAGEKSVLMGMTNASIPQGDGEIIKVKIESKVCTTNNSYSGLPCKEYLNIIPGAYKIYTAPWGKVSNKVEFTVLPSSEKMSLTLYIQDKEVARTRDCGITKKVVYQVPKTTAVADASLKILFQEELAQYGVYKSVSISNGVAKVMLSSENTPAGYPIGSLSSCQSIHLMSVLEDTLKQYSSIKSVELYNPKGKIVF